MLFTIAFVIEQRDITRNSKPFLDIQGVGAEYAVPNIVVQRKLRELASVKRWKSKLSIM
jgi:hypothetical protein